MHRPDRHECPPGQSRTREQRLNETQVEHWPPPQSRSVSLPSRTPLAHWHWLATHGPTEHVVPQLPQFLLSPVVSTQRPPHIAIPAEHPGSASAARGASGPVLASRRLCASEPGGVSMTGPTSK